MDMAVKSRRISTILSISGTFPKFGANDLLKLMEQVKSIGFLFVDGALVLIRGDVTAMAVNCHLISSQP
ncbi:hypothetical protein U1Q18_039165 [Sarracenia purpurea var. burkii]